MSGSVETGKTAATVPGAVGIAPAGHRLPAPTRLGKVRLQIASLDRSLAWYERILGLTLLDRTAGSARLGAQGSATPLVELRERPGAKPVPPRGRLGLYHFALLLPDRSSLGAFLRHLAALGERAGASDHAVSEALYLQDPDGIGVEVYSDRPRSDWGVHEREIHMDTRPLDTADLARASRSGQWAGMPAGTSVGHVHLHVADLAEADAFYHDGLGLDKVVWSYPGALFLSAGGYHHHLGLNTWATGASPAGEDDVRLLDWELVLPTQEDVDAAETSLRAKSHHVFSDDDEVKASDPWGTTLRVVHGPVDD